MIVFPHTALWYKARLVQVLRAAYEFERDTVTHKFNEQAPLSENVGVQELQRLESGATKALKAEEPPRYWANYLAARLNIRPETLRELGYPVTAEQQYKAAYQCLRAARSSIQA